ncbi:MAG: TIGR03086 family protein [Chloroflexi bacterium]|nr:TIGR03086 family protein [Chloroflexota bacterium]
MAQQGPGPIELYEGAIQQMLPILGAVKADQLSGATPCSEWNVQNLINHNIKVAEFIYDVIAETGTADPSVMRAVNDPLPEEGAEAAFQAATARVLEAIKASGKLEKVLDTPFGQMPAGHLLMIPFGDIVLHKWDLAKATGQNTSIDSGLAEACFAAMSPGIGKARDGGFYGREVLVPLKASIQDKLLGLSGRQPLFSLNG